MSLNEWVTKNANLVSFVNIALTILLTALNVWFARNSQKFSRESLKQNERIRHENNTPNVIAYFDTKDLRLISFNLSNQGTNAAKNIKIKLKPLNRNQIPDHLKGAHMLQEGVAFLAPGQTVSALTASFFEVIDENKSFPSYHITIEFQDIDDNSYERAYTLDLNMYNGYYQVNKRDVHDLNKEVQKIEKHIKTAVDIFKHQDRRKRAIEESTILKNTRRVKRL